MPSSFATRTVASIAAVFGVMLLAACTPSPPPTPTPTPLFASEEEAFAAAEETYRAYIDAANQRRADATSADPQSYLSGRALEASISAERKLEERNVKIIGENEIISVQGQSVEIDQGSMTVITEVCLGLGTSRVVNDNGEDVTPPNRPPRGLLKVSLESVKDRLLITNSELSEGEC